MDAATVEPEKGQLRARAWVTVEEAAELAEVTPFAIRDWLTTGITIRTAKGRQRVALRGTKVGRRWRIKPADLDEFIRVLTQASQSPNALPPAGSGETEAQRRTRAASAKAEAARRLGG